MELFAMLNGFVSQFGQWESNQRANGAGEQWQAELITYLTGQVATGGYPHLAATFASGADQSLDSDVVFARSLDRIVRVILEPAAA
jgi:Tetracyclin repressor-like, C-terminal domain